MNNKERRLKMFASPNVSLTVLAASGTMIDTQEYGKLIDFESGCWAAVLGHNKQAIFENTEFPVHTHHFFESDHPGALVKELTDAANLDCKYAGTFISSGSEAVSLAISLAELISGRQRKLSLSISYLGASPDLRLPRNPEQWTDLDISDCLYCTENLKCKECGKFNDINFSQMAAFVLEPGNSGGLVVFPSNKLITFLVTEIRNSGGLIIINEVTTGFGRTGKWFGFQHYDVFNSRENLPDLISIGKGLGNGYPISGLLIKPELAKIVESTGFRYVQSHIDDPLGCLIARNVIDTMVREKLVEKGNQTGEYLRTRLIELGNETDGIIEVRGRGMMNVAVLAKRHKAKEVFQRLLENGCFVGYSEVHNIIRFYSPLIMDTQDIDVLCSSLKLVLSAES